MAGRRAKQDEWEPHKDEIHRLFITEDRKVSEVVELMTQRYGFTRTYAEEPHPQAIDMTIADIYVGELSTRPP